ncbi:MAG: methionyl-tRNA formyltransferase, partial [Polyangiaceae bacterium]|nr:methionyl-tRNA formyltransferase [Polyangiaceae bacterium]
RILSQEVLDAPVRGCMNLHASLLPKYRGAAPVNWAVVRGETETGVCLMQMDAGMDTGPVLSAHAIPIGPDETAGEVAERIAALAAEVVRVDLERAVRGQLVPRQQDHDRATLAPMLQKSDGAIDWTQPAQRVHDHARGMTPWPGAFTHVRGKVLKVHRTRVRAGNFPQTAGTVVIADASAVVVTCGAGGIELLQVQLEGRRAMTAGQMAVGRGLLHGDVLSQPTG